MSRGGTRTNAGRKSEFEGATERIRLPIEYHEQLREIAHRLEQGETIDFGTQSVEGLIDGFLMTLKPKQRLQVEPLFRRFRKYVRG